MAVSVREVAAAAGVSIGTVSNVLNWPERVAESTIEEVNAAIEKLGYVRNDAARQLRAGRSRSLGLVVPDAGNPFFADVARGASARAQEERLFVLLGSSDEDDTREDDYLDLFREQRVNGVLIAPAHTDATKLLRAHKAGLPIVLVDHEIPGSAFASVTVDDVRGGYLAMRHLLDTGRRRIAFVAPDTGIAQVEKRIIGARQALVDFPDARFELLTAGGLTVLPGRAVGEAILRRPTADRPDAVFATNDLLALGVMQALSLSGDVRVPEDIALIGYDDIDYAGAALVPLSSIRQPAREVGATAVELLLQEIQHPGGEHERRIVFQPELVIRASTAPRSA